MIQKLILPLNIFSFKNKKVGTITTGANKNASTKFFSTQVYARVHL